MCPLLSFWSLFLALFGLLSTIIETEIENKGLIFFFFFRAQYCKFDHNFFDNTDRNGQCLTVQRSFVISKVQLVPMNTLGLPGICK